MAHFITFEGVEGSGKSTQIKLAGEFLSREGIPCLVTEEPGGTPLGLKIRELLLHRHDFSITSLSELLLFQASRCQHVETVIRPALAEGIVVLCDRYTDATIAYQGFGRGISRERIHLLNDIATAALKPERTFLFDLPAATGLTRAKQRMDLRQDLPREDRFEEEALAFHQQVRSGYLILARDEPQRFTVLDGTRSIEELQQAIRASLTGWIKG